MTITLSALPNDILTHLSKLTEAVGSGTLVMLVAKMENEFLQTGSLTLTQELFERLQCFVNHFEQEYEGTELGKTLSELSLALLQAKCAEERPLSELEIQVMSVISKLLDDRP